MTDEKRTCDVGNCAACGGCAETEDEYVTPRVIFTEEMKSTYHILLPNMLPNHIKILSRILNYMGYDTELLEDGTHGDSRTVIDNGLKYVHNDTCYPALLVIGQFITALESGRYDPHKTALMMTQTGGGCRASNYIPLIRKALAKAGYGYVPVISFNFAGLEKNPGFRISLPSFVRMAYGMLYADLIMFLSNQCRPYEIREGETDRVAAELTNDLSAELGTKKWIGYGTVRKNYKKIIKAFADISIAPRESVKVGIVGEIYIKFSPLGNNGLEAFLNREGAEVVMGGLVDFCVFMIYNGLVDNKLYKRHKFSIGVYRIAYRFLCFLQKDLIKIVRKNSNFALPPYFDHVKDLVKGYIGYGAKMGEGWLLTAEMLDLVEEGVDNIVCAQPFGCLPNHIVGKGKMNIIKERNEGVNIVAVDYDPGATKINQENRLKLMLANAKKTPMRRRNPEDTAK